MSTGATDQQIRNAAERAWNRTIDDGLADADAERWADLPEGQQAEEIAQMRYWAECLVPEGYRIAEPDPENSILKRARLAKSLTIAAASSQVGISVRELSRMERGVGNPRYTTLRRMSALYGMPIEELWPEQDDERPTNGVDEDSDPEADTSFGEDNPFEDEEDPYEEA